MGVENIISVSEHFRFLDEAWRALLNLGWKPCLSLHLTTYLQTDGTLLLALVAVARGAEADTATTQFPNGQDLLLTFLCAFPSLGELHIGPGACSLFTTAVMTSHFLFFFLFLPQECILVAYLSSDISHTQFPSHIFFLYPLVTFSIESNCIYATSRLCCFHSTGLQHFKIV